MHIHAEHNGVKFNCTICFKEFKRKGSLDRHMTGVHKTVSTKSLLNLDRFEDSFFIKLIVKNVLKVMQLL